MTAGGSSAPVRAYTVADVRAAEATVLASTGGDALMQRAAAGLATACARALRERRGRVTGSRVLLLIGAGNNGGDALWAGQRLARRGVRVTAALAARTVHPPGLAALRAAGGRVLPLVPPAQGLPGGVPDTVAVALGRGADLVVDGLVGLGGSPGLREPAAALVAALPEGVPVVAVDLPSGVAPDTGETPAPHVRADLTVTFGAPKPCLLLPPACRAAGQVVEVDIGLGPLLPARPAVERLDQAAAGRLWPVPGPLDDKYRRGVLGVVGGSATYPGAAVLVCDAAVHAGAGMVRYLGPTAVADRVRARAPEVVAGPGRVQAWALGSGVDPGADDGQADAVAAALATGSPAVLDAGALDLLTRRPGLRAHLGPHLLLTPHAGELARLLTEWDGTGPRVTREEVEARPVHHARLAADLTGAVVLLKGSVTLVVAPDGRVRSQDDAPAWLATAGAGDVLAGLAGVLLAAGLPTVDAGAVAALVHGRAAVRAAGGPGSGVAGSGGPVPAREVARALPATVAECLRAAP